jgi:hypothetical protein
MVTHETLIRVREKEILALDGLLNTYTGKREPHASRLKIGITELEKCISIIQHDRDYPVVG